jgi:hypothetical protein
VGFYYLLLLLIGVVLLVVGALWKGVSWSVKIIIFLCVVGILCIVMAIILLMPGSSDIISELLKLND